MKTSYLYITERIDIFCPNYTEYLWDIIAIIKNDNKYISNDVLKYFTLAYVSEMIEKDIIYVGNEWITNNTLKYWELSKDEIINRINEMWFENAEYPDFLGMVWFGFQEWYIEALKKEGYGKERMLWADFVEKNIGDLEKWIEENKPKDGIDDENK